MVSLAPKSCEQTKGFEPFLKQDALKNVLAAMAFFSSVSQRAQPATFTRRTASTVQLGRASHLWRVLVGAAANAGGVSQ